MSTPLDRTALAVLNVRLGRVGGQVRSPVPDGNSWLVHIELPGEPIETVRGDTPEQALASASVWVEAALRDRGAE